MTVATISSPVGHGIKLGAGNYGLTLTVAGGGAVQGTSYAVYGPSLSSNEMVVNDGLIAATGYGIFLESQGSLLNAGSVSGGNLGAVMIGSAAYDGKAYFTNTGRISGGTYGAYLEYLTASNSGTIIGGKTGLRMAGQTLVNSGGISGGTIGLLIQQGTLTNTGSGHISSQGVGLLEGSFANAVLIRNAGSIYGGAAGVYLTDGGLNNTGTVGSSTIGVWLTTANGQNSGLIYGNTIGVYIDGSAEDLGFKFTNANTGTVESSAGIGISAADARYLFNYGTIGGKAAAVYVDATPFINTGVLNGGSVGLAVLNAAVSDTGTITGGTYAVEAEGAFILDLTGTAVLNGKVLDQTGTGVLDLTNGPGSLGGIGSTIMGFSSIEIAPGWTVEGNEAGLAAGQVIAGFTTTDTMVLDGFSASFSSLGAAGLTLSNGHTTETIGLTAIPVVSDLTITSNGVNTTIACAQPIAPISIISTFEPATFALGLNNVATSLTVSSTGYAASVKTSLYNHGTVTNFGSISNVNFGTYSTLSNFGVIAGTVGVSGGDIDTNAGTIIGTGNAGIGVRLPSLYETLFNSGLIASDGTAVYVNGDDHVLNTGSIAGGVIFKNYDYLINSGNISGRSTFGIDSLEGDIENSGTIMGPEIGIAEPDGGGTINNTGTIAGSEYGISLAGGTIIDSGLISGATDAIFNNDRPPYSFSLFTLSLEIDPGATIAGGVVDQSNEGTLFLGGSTAGALDMGTSFSGFSDISFNSGSVWRLEGAAGDLAGRQTITGFSFADTIILDNFVVNALATTYVNGSGLQLTDTAGNHLTLDITGNFTTADFIVTDPAGDTSIALAVCYLRGTRIATPAGEVPVEGLNIGDAVITRFNGYRKIKWIGRQSFARRFVANNFDQIPVRITAGALGGGLPRRDLFISPGHSMLIDGVLVLAKSLVNGITITQNWVPEEVHYYQIEFETHDCVLAEGAWSESYADTPEFRAKFHNVAEFYALYPGHVEPEGQVLCAPRPLAGPALAAVLAPIVKRVPAVAGRLHGYIDEVSGGAVRGWAWDEANPYLPVTLEILLRGRVIGRVLACDYRRDLVDAGYGRGRCGFEFASALGLPVDAARHLHIRGAGTSAAWVSLALNPSYGGPYLGRCMSKRVSGVMRA